MALRTVRIMVEGEGGTRNIQVSGGDHMIDLKDRLSEVLGRPIESISLYYLRRKLSNNWLASGYVYCTQQKPIVVRVQGGVVAVAEGGELAEEAAEEVAEEVVVEEAAEEVVEEVVIEEAAEEVAAEVGEGEGWKGRALGLLIGTTLLSLTAFGLLRSLGGRRRERRQDH